MQISISGKHMETGEALKEYVEEHLLAAVEKYFENAINAEVVFSKRDHLFICHIKVDEGVKDKPLAINAEAEAGDVHEAFNAALAKAAKQLRRDKRRLKDRSNRESLSSLSAKAAATSA